MRSTNSSSGPDGEDLKELGVAALGHRRKLLDAIAALRTMRAARRLPLTRRPVQRPKRPSRRPRRAPPSHGDVLGPCGLNGALGPHGP